MFTPAFLGINHILHFYLDVLVEMLHAVCEFALRAINSPGACLGHRDNVFPESVCHIINIRMTMEYFENTPEKPVFSQNTTL